MTKVKYLVLIFLLCALLFIMPNISNAAVEYTRTITGNDGSITINLKGLTLDENKQYEFSLVSKGGTPTNWHLITDFTSSTATINLSAGTADIRDVLKVTDNGQLFVREKVDTNNDIVPTSNIIVDRLNIDLKLPYLKAVNYDRDEPTSSRPYCWYSIGSMYGAIGSRTNTYYKFEKITDKKFVEEFLKDKKNTERLESLLPTVEDRGYAKGNYFASRDYSDGLYVLWIKMLGENCKTIQAAIIHDGLPNAKTLAEYGVKTEDNKGDSANVALESVSLPKTATVELGKTLTLSPTFNPTTATNKTVTWSSSDETVATVDNAGKVTPKKLGSTIITVTSKDGNKKATCTVTVTQASNNTQNPSTPNNTPILDIKDNGGSGSLSTSNDSGSSIKDTTIASGKIPQTGATMTFALVVIALISTAVFGFVKYNKLKDI